jgi:multidrug efflux pump subunit AcrB
MTTFAAIFALMPLAMNLGTGSEMLQPLIIAIVSELIVQIPLVLIVLPILLQLLNQELTLNGCRPICDSQHHNSLIFF